MQDVCKYTSRPREPRHRCNELQELKTESDEVQTCEWPCQVKQGLAGCDDSQQQDTSIQLARGEYLEMQRKKLATARAYVSTQSSAASFDTIITSPREQ